VFFKNPSKKNWTRILLFTVLIVTAALPVFIYLYSMPRSSVKEPDRAKIEITGIIRKGETLFDIFRRSQLDPRELSLLKESMAGVHRLSSLIPGQPYKITLDGEKRVTAFEYWINDNAFVNISRGESGFRAEKVTLEYEKRPLLVTGVIEDNLITSIGESRENLLLALSLSDIFAWDIDFNTDLRKGGRYRLIVEGCFRDGQFRKYGDILAAEFINDGQVFRAYRFDINGKAGYYNAEGDSLRKQFLKAPLSFRNISSGFSRSRMHPILKIRRPHQGIDYVAPAGTPVSATADGKVTFAGQKGQYGRLVVIRHRNGYQTSYGHLSRIKTRNGAAVAQGQIIGYVGSSGMSTGPHLHFELRKNQSPVNPRKADIPRGEPIPNEWMSAFNGHRDRLDQQMASLRSQEMAKAGPQPLKDGR
jgi:murein DD-endopeptidase MepM/ murein hydrolase activator NlpD